MEIIIITIGGILTLFLYCSLKVASQVDEIENKKM